MTHVATAHAVELVGAKPVFVDAEPSTGNIDIDQIEAAITPNTRALSLVHYLGMPVDMDRINAIAAKHDLFVVEDAALAVGTTYKGVHAGLLGDIGLFSFYPVKHMTTLEGGMVLSKHPEVLEKITLQRAFGVDRTHGERKIPGEYDVNMLGMNYRMNEVQAAIGSLQVGRLDSFLEARRANHAAITGRLADCERLDQFETTGGDFVSSCYCHSIVLKDGLETRRVEFIEALKAKGVGTSIYYPRPVPDLTYYSEKYGYQRGEYPEAARIAYHSIALPVGPHLQAGDAEYIAEIRSQNHRRILMSEIQSVKGKSVVLVGGAGFIGHNLALYLREQGAEVAIIDGLGVNNLMSFSSTSVDAVNRELYLDILNERQDLLREAGVPVHVQDARDYHALTKLITEIKPQIVVQLAAVSHANKSNKDPFHDLRSQFPNPGERARCFPRPGRAFHLLLVEHGLRQLQGRRRHRGVEV